MSTRITLDESKTMRELGSNLTEKGIFEINLISGEIPWVNDFVLSKYGMTLNQIQSMTLFDLIPVDHHDALNNFVDDASKGRAQKFSIWPGKTADNKLVWWYITKIKSDHPLHWYKAEYLNTTEKHGSEYASMLAAMDTANSYND